MALNKCCLTWGANFHELWDGAPRGLSNIGAFLSCSPARMICTFATRDLCLEFSELERTIGGYGNTFSPSQGNVTPRAASPQRFPANLECCSTITPPPPALLHCRLKSHPRVWPKPMGSETVIARFAGGRQPRGSVNLQNVYVQIKSFRWEDPMSTQCWILTQQDDSTPTNSWRCFGAKFR